VRKGTFRTVKHRSRLKDFNGCLETVYEQLASAESSGTVLLLRLERHIFVLRTRQYAFYLPANTRTIIWGRI